MKSNALHMTTRKFMNDLFNIIRHYQIILNNHCNLPHNTINVWYLLQLKGHKNTTFYIFDLAWIWTGKPFNKILIYNHKYIFQSNSVNIKTSAPLKNCALFPSSLILVWGSLCVYSYHNKSTTKQQPAFSSALDHTVQNMMYRNTHIYQWLKINIQSSTGGLVKLN